MTEFYVQVDFNQIPVKNIVVEGSPTPPEDPETGQMYVDTTDPDNAVLMYWEGTEWLDLGPPIQGPPGPEGPAGPQGPEGPPGGAYVTAMWQYQANTNPPPLTGALRTAATNDMAYLSKTDDDGIDRSAALTSLVTGDKLVINPTSGAGRIEITLTGDAVDSGTYVTFPYDVTAGTPNPDKATKVEISLLRPPEPAPMDVRFSATEPTENLAVGTIWVNTG